MTINLSEETIQTVYIALVDSKKNVQKQLRNGTYDERVKDILKYQLEEIQNALSVFEELMERI